MLAVRSNVDVLVLQLFDKLVTAFIKGLQRGCQLGAWDRNAAYSP